MDEVTKELQKIRKRAYERRKRDTYGQYALESHAERSEGLFIRLTAEERDMIRRAAVAAGETITDTVVHSVRLCSTLIR